MIHKYRILIVSNECLSNETSNGRTLRNFLLGWPKENMAQFYIQNGNPDFDICDNYFNFTDRQALKYFFRRKHVSTNQSSNYKELKKNSRNELKRNAFSMLLREIVWNNSKWMNDFFLPWVVKFQPHCILLQAGDNAFMFKIARFLSTKFNIPIVIYNSENYYFKKHDYFRSTGFSHLIYPIYHSYFKKKFSKLINFAYISIYNSDELRKDYENEFGMHSETIYTATEIKPNLKERTSENFKICYLGNLGVGRHETLIDFANILHSISTDIYLEIYGKVPNRKVEEGLLTCEGIKYRGFVSYDEVINIMKSSHVLVHVENFSPFFVEGLKRAFSTKIADSLGSGTCFVLYASDDLACSKYLISNKVAYVASNENALLNILKDLIINPEARNKYIENALSIVEKNHNPQKNADFFQNILIKAINDTKN